MDIMKSTHVKLLYMYEYEQIGNAYTFQTMSARIILHKCMQVCIN